MGKKEKKEKKKTKKIILFIILVLIIIAGIVFGARIQENGGGMQGVIATALGQNEETLKNLKPIYCLVVGKSGGMTDTIMLCAYDPQTQKASMLSIPRDTFYGKNKDTATADYKINSLYSNGGIKKMVAAVEKVVGIEIPYYAVIDTDGLIELVDVIGGVEFDVPIDMKYDDPTQDLHINLKAGVQTINGEKAEQLLRFRHNNDGSSYPASYGDNDYGRMRTQREFIKAAIEQTLTAKNVTKIKDIITVGFNNLETNIKLDDILDYVPYVVNFSTENISSEMLPGQSEKCNGIWIFIHSNAETKKTVNKLFTFTSTALEDEETSTIGDGVKVEIINGTNDKTLTTSLKKKLENNGYTVTSTYTSSEVSKTVIIKRTDSDEKTNNLKSVMNINQVSTSDKNSKVDFTIIIGKDFEE